MPRSSRDPQVGAVVDGRFHVKRPLAAGGMATVYVARDGADGARVALKVLPASKKTPPTMVALMEREALALGRLDHPHISRKIASGPLDDGGFYIAMELVSNAVSLTTYVRQHHLEVPASLALIEQLCDALSHVHSHGLVHRDVKAGNVLVTQRDGEAHVMLIDFGIVSFLDEEEVDPDKPLLGGLHTSAPEQIRGERVDPRTDLYAVGVLLFRLLAGRYPFHSKLPAEILALHLNGEPPELPSHLPHDLRVVVMRCLQKDPDERIQTADDVRLALRGAEESLPAPRWPWALAVMAVLVLLGLIYGFVA